MDYEEFVEQFGPVLAFKVESLDFKDLLERHLKPCAYRQEPQEPQTEINWDEKWLQGTQQEKRCGKIVSALLQSLILIIIIILIYRPDTF